MSLNRVNFIYKTFTNRSRMSSQGSVYASQSVLFKCGAPTIVTRDDALRRRFVFPAHSHLSPHLKFIRASWRGIIYEQICSRQWLVLFFCFTPPSTAPPLGPPRDCLSDSPLYNGAILPKLPIQKLAVFFSKTGI